MYQRDVLYYPSPQYNHHYQSKTFHNENETIEVIVLNEGKENGIIYFGGNGESIVHSAPDHLKNFPQHTVYLVNYRGYGGSSGTPDEQGIYSDALHIYDQLKPQHKTISVIGRSLGSGVATYIGSKREINKMGLITPYDSIESIAKFHYPIFPTSLLITDKYDSIGRIKNIKAKTLIILAENDSIIPLENSERLINKFPPQQIKVEVIKNSGHNNLSRTKKYHALLKDFMWR